MSFSATAAAAAIARSRSSSPRFVSTTCAACKHPGEAQGVSRHTTEDLFEVREGLRFDSRGLRTLSSSRLIEVQAPTSLDTELELEGDSVAVPRAPTAPLRCARYGLAQGSSADACRLRDLHNRQAVPVVQITCQQLAASTGRAHSCNAISGEQPKVHHRFHTRWTPPTAAVNVLLATGSCSSHIPRWARCERAMDSEMCLKLTL